MLRLQGNSIKSLLMQYDSKLHDVRKQLYICMSKWYMLQSTKVEWTVG